jgi:hypothetical protein
MQKIFALALLALLLFGCASQGAKGFVEGEVTIGPLCPVEPCQLTYEQIDQAYSSRSVVIYAEDQRTILQQFPLTASGHYRAELAPGTYFVTIRPGGIGDYPLQQVSISSGQTTTLDMDVDTGIR